MTDEPLTADRIEGIIWDTRKGGPNIGMHRSAAVAWTLTRKERSSER